MTALIIALTVMFMCAFCAIGDLAIEQEKSASDAGTPGADKENNPKSEYLTFEKLSSLPPQSATVRTRKKGIKFYSINE